jgi:hypothetical protein
MEEVLNIYLGNIQRGTKQVFGNLTIIPLYSKLENSIKYVTLKEALQKNFLRVAEINEGGSVPELAVVNDGNIFVLLLDGEELRGAKQNRVLNASILVEPNSKTVVPVSCTEQGRWAYNSDNFEDSGVVMASFARSKKMASVSRSLKESRSYRSNQGEVWDEVSALTEKLSAHSPTGAMRDAFESRKEQLDAYQTNFPLQEGQQGMLVILGGKVAGLDILSKPEAYAELHAKLVQSYAIDALTIDKPVAEFDAEEMAFDFLAEAAHAQTETFESSGYGQDIRIDGKLLHGTCLVADEAVIHLALFRKEVENMSAKVEPMASWSRRRRYHH